MSANHIVDCGEKLPLIQKVEARSGWKVEVTWKDGTSKVVNLAPLIFDLKFYAPLRENHELFAAVSVVRGGSALAWGDDEAIDMSASSVDRLANEMMSPHDFSKFMKRNEYTLERAAAELGVSRRQVAYFTKEKEVPRYIYLACQHIDMLRVQKESRAAPNKQDIKVDGQKLRVVGGRDQIAQDGEQGG